MEKKAEVHSIVLLNTCSLFAKGTVLCNNRIREATVRRRRRLTIFLRSNMQPVYKEGLEDEEYLEMVEKMMAFLTPSESGWIVVKIVQLNIGLALFAPVTSSPYIALPNQL